MDRHHIHLNSALCIRIDLTCDYDPLLVSCVGFRTARQLTRLFLFMCVAVYKTDRTRDPVSCKPRLVRRSDP